MSARARLVRLLEAVRAHLLGPVLWPGLVVRNRWSRASVTDPRSDLAVNLTTYGVRLRSVHLVIESIARGRRRPGLLVLWLSRAEAAEPLPAGLRRLQARGLSVRPCEDLKSHKKYHPFVDSELSRTHALVTADDDVYYPAGWLAGMDRARAVDPTAVWCYRSRTMRLGNDGRPAPYVTWPTSQEPGPSRRLVPIGVSGVLYPPAVVDEIRREGTGFLRVAPYADDLWLHARTLAAGASVRRVRPAWHFPVAPARKGVPLMARNLGGGNDEVVRHVYAAGVPDQAPHEEARE